jgi:hypothetical protein
MATHDHAIVDAMRRRVVQLERGRVLRDESRGVYETTAAEPTVLPDDVTVGTEAIESTEVVTTVEDDTATGDESEEATGTASSAETQLAIDESVEDELGRETPGPATPPDAEDGEIDDVTGEVVAIAGPESDDEATAGKAPGGTGSVDESASANGVG